jgi:predicted nucleotidyltransferase
MSDDAEILKRSEERRKQRMALTRKEKKAIELFKARLTERLPDEKVELLLFGSKARGDDRRGSDIDLMLLMKERSLRAVNDMHRAVTETALATDVYNISLKTLSRSEFLTMKRRRTPFVCGLLKDAVRI